MFCDNLEGRDRMGGGKFKPEGPYVCLWLIHVGVWQKPTQYCKTIILQLKVNFKNLKNYVTRVLKDKKQKTQQGSGSSPSGTFHASPPSLEPLQFLCQLFSSPLGPRVLWRHPSPGGMLKKNYPEASAPFESARLMASLKGVSQARVVRGGASCAARAGFSS